MDAKVTGAFDKWEPATLDVDIKPFLLRNRTKFVPRALGKAPWAWGRGRNRTTRPILGTLDSVIQQIFVVESGIRGFRIRNPTNDWNPKSKFHGERIRNPIPRIRNPRRGIQNSRLSWISLHRRILQLFTL